MYDSKQKEVFKRVAATFPATFGLRAAGPALLTNESLFQQKIMTWDPEHMLEATS